MRGVRIKIVEQRWHMKLYPVLHCGQVKVSQLPRDNHVFSWGGGPQS